jgi:uroporphyrinogen decarboxylase
MSAQLLVQTFEGTNSHVPVWFMRQAGRFLPEYRKIREKYSLGDMFRHPQIAADVTCLPVDILDVDAAILFADILTLPSGMGFNVGFGAEGPVIHNPVLSPADIENVHDMEELDYVADILRRVRSTLAPSKSLIGFAGSPFTVLCYLLKPGARMNMPKVLRFAYEHPGAFDALMAKLTRNTIAYLRLQLDAGADAYQLFDSWGGVLREADYRRWILPSVQEIFRQVGGRSIYYVKNSSHLLHPMIESGARFVSLCETVDLAADPRLKNFPIGIQGNLFNGLMYAPSHILLDETRRILDAGRSFKGHIFNLSHGIHPDMDPDQAKRIVDAVHAFDARRGAR